MTRHFGPGIPGLVMIRRVRPTGPDHDLACHTRPLGHGHAAGREGTREHSGGPDVHVACAPNGSADPPPDHDLGGCDLGHHVGLIANHNAPVDLNDPLNAPRELKVALADDLPLDE